MAAKDWSREGGKPWEDPRNWVQAGHEVAFQKPCAEGHSHCYHKNGIIMTSDPPQYEKKCCWCGDKIVAMDPQPNPACHGPFLEYSVQAVFGRPIPQKGASR